MNNIYPERESTKSFFFILLGPSGVGKSTLIKRIINEFSEISYYPSYTTRSPRPGEVNGQDYFFIKESEFKQKIEQGDFIEIDRPHNSYYYGIAKEPLNTSLLVGKSFIKETAINALNELLKSDLNKFVISIFLKPIDLLDVKTRLINRNSETDQDRLKSVEKEMLYEQSCSHTIHIKHNEIDYGLQQLVKILFSYISKNP